MRFDVMKPARQAGSAGFSNTPRINRPPRMARPSLRTRSNCADFVIRRDLGNGDRVGESGDATRYFT
jgi:hypothetical protein